MELSKVKVMLALAMFSAIVAFSFITCSRPAGDQPAAEQNAIKSTSDPVVPKKSASSGTYLGAAMNAREHAQRTLNQVQSERQGQKREADQFDSKKTSPESSPEP